MIGKRISHYSIVEELGRGGMGIVYLAEDTKLNRSVALKFLPPEFSSDKEAGRRFIREARAAAALNHPNICTIHEIDEHEGQSFIAMEHIEGRSLRDLVDGGPLPIGQAIEIAMQTASGLAEAHEKNVVHRDIKPANIMITAKGRVKITDFGMALLHGGTLLTKEGTTLGTVAYMSPEQAHGQDVDLRADIWSLGAMLYEMISGRRPFKGDYDQAMIYSILNDECEPLTAIRTGVPRELERIVTKCLSKDRSERYQTSADLIADLRHLSRTLESEDAAATAKAPPRRGLRWLPLLAPVALVLILAAVYFSGILDREERQGDETAGDGRQMIVVLPFENLGPPDDGYFADGITDAITARLAGISGLGVISRQSAMQYKGTDKSVDRISEELGVDFILEGTIQRERRNDPHSRVRIIPQLIRCADDIHLWAGTLDGEMTDIFGLQSDIAEQVAGELDVTLLGRERSTLETRPTENLEAYDYYLQALEYWNRITEPDIVNQVLRLLELAVEADPEFALAWGRLSSAHVWTYWMGMNEEGIAKAESAAQRAAGIDPDLPEIDIALGFIQYYGYRDYEKAGGHFNAMLEKTPNSFYALSGLALIRRRQGRWEESLDCFERALRINPRDFPTIYDGLGNTLLSLRRYDEALEMVDRALLLNPKLVIPYLFKASILLNRDGDIEEARRCMERMTEFSTRAEKCFVLQRFEKEQIARICYGSACSYFDRLSLNDDCEMDWPIDLSDRSLYRYICEGDDSEKERILALADSVRDEFARGRAGRQPFIVALDHLSLGKLYALLGRTEDALRQGRLAIEKLPVSKDAVDAPVVLSGAADIDVLTGEYDAAFDKLEILLSIPCEVSMRLIDLDPLYEPLRDHPRHRAMAEKYPYN